jgi:recombination protein RecA
VVDKSGAWYSYGKERIGQGRENAKLFLKDNTAMAGEIEEKVKVHLGIAEAPEAPVIPETPEVPDAVD